MYFSFLNVSVSIKITTVSCWTPFLLISRSSRADVFCKKGVLKNLTKFTGKYLFLSLFFNKVSALRLRLKKRFWRMCFPVNFVKLLKIAFSIEHLWWLLLNQFTWVCFDCKAFYLSVPTQLSLVF